VKTKKTEMSVDEIKAFRTRHKFTQKSLADLLGVTWQAVRFWELGERNIPQTTVRLLVLFKKFPQLMQEF